MGIRATRATHLGLFLTAASVLMLEVALTRVFAVMLYNHYTFLVIAMALLGFGAAGSYLSSRDVERSEDQVRKLVARSCLGFALSTVICLVVVTRLGLEQFELQLDFNTLKLVGAYGILAIPFFFAGLAICLTLSVCSSQINTIYFADLLGAGCGALVVTMLLNRIGTPTTIVLACTLCIVGGLLFAGNTRRRSGTAWIAAFATLAVAVFFLDPWRVPVAASKALHGNEENITSPRWTAHGRIDVLESMTIPVDTGTGVSPEFFGRPVTCRPFFMDGSNPSRLYQAGQDRWFLSNVLTAAPYLAGPRKPSVLIIGSGGGIDTQVALEHEASRVTAVEINPYTVELTRELFADYIGNIFDRPNVRLIASEGRHFLSLDHSKYDVIRLTGVDTQSTAAFGANALDHYYLYTIEAIQDFYDHLDEDGILSMSRRVGWQGMRLVNLMIHALEEKGVERIADRLVIVSNQRSWDVMARRRPYRQSEVESLRQWAAQAKLRVVYDPFVERADPVANLILGGPGERQSIVRNSEFDLRPVTDDNPFFFESMTLGGVLRRLFAGKSAQSMFSGYSVLLIALAQSIVLSALFIFLPLWRKRKGVGQIAGRWWVLAYFALLGLGFILVELVTIQKFMIVLGGPAYSMSVTLFSILVFSGLGAFTAKRLRISSHAALTGMAGSIVLLLAASMLFLDDWLAFVLTFAFLPRVLLSIVSLAPISFALGFPFPTGIRILDRAAPQLVPWAWASNACLTVIGSVLCVILSISWGFSTAFAVAAGCYVLAGVCVNRMVGDRIRVRC
jgi:spermidine synthase